MSNYRLIKDYCVNVEASIKPIYLKKHNLKSGSHV